MPFVLLSVALPTTVNTALLQRWFAVGAVIVMAGFATSTNVAVTTALEAITNGAALFVERTVLPSTCTSQFVNIQPVAGVTVSATDLPISKSWPFTAPFTLPLPTMSTPSGAASTRMKFTLFVVERLPAASPRPPHPVAVPPVSGLRPDSPPSPPLRLRRKPTTSPSTSA